MAGFCARMSIVLYEALDDGGRIRRIHTPSGATATRQKIVL